MPSMQPLTRYAWLSSLARSSRLPSKQAPFSDGVSWPAFRSSGVEGALVLGAAVGIVWTALPRLLAPEPLEQVGLGRAISVAASAVNFGIARTLFRAGRLSNSIVLEADAHHLMTDVWTSVGVLVGIVAGSPHWLATSRSHCRPCGRR